LLTTHESKTGAWEVNGKVCSLLTRADEVIELRRCPLPRGSADMLDAVAIRDSAAGLDSKFIY
jgi:hypothetical protein